MYFLKSIKSHYFYLGSIILRLINHHSAVIAIGAGSRISKFYSTLLDYLLDLAYI